MINGDMADRVRDEAAAQEAMEAYDKFERKVFSGKFPWGPPSEKDPAVEELLESMSGRTTSIKSGTCVPAPIGCGLPITGFSDALSQKEYQISGLCQECQDSVFG